MKNTTESAVCLTCWWNAEDVLAIVDDKALTIYGRAINHKQKFPEHEVRFYDHIGSRRISADEVPLQIQR